MHARGIGLVLGFFLLNFLDLHDLAQGKAFPEDEEEYNYRYKQKLKRRFQPLSKQNLPPKLYYTPHIDGQPIFLPAVGGSMSHVKKFLDDHYERNKEYEQRWTFETPATYDYDHNNQRDYYEDSVTSNSMIKNLLDTHESGVHRGDYHILSITPESYVSYESKQTNEDFKVKNKSDKQNLRKKDKKKKINKDSHEFSKDQISKYKFETVAPDYAPEVVEVIGKKLPSDEAAEDVIDIKLSDYDYGTEQMGDKEHPDDYASENVDEEFSHPAEEAVDAKLPDYHYAPDEVDDEELSDDYAPEVVEVIGKNVLHAPNEVVGTKFTDYSSEAVEVTNSKLSDNYSPEVVKVIGSKLADDYSPEVVTVVETKLTKDKSNGVDGENFLDHGPEIVEVVNIKRKTEQLYLPKRKLLSKNTGDKNYGEVTSKEPFISKKYKDKIKKDKIIKQNSDDKVSSNVYKWANKKSKLIYKQQSQFKSETRDPNGYLISVKKNSDPQLIAMNSGKLNYKKAQHTKKPDYFKKENSNKIKPAITSKNEHLTFKTQNIKEKDVIADSSKSTLGGHGKITSTHGITRDLEEDETLQKMEDFNSHEDLLNEHFNSDESFEEFDLESPGSGDIVDNEDISSLHNADFPRSLSALNSNIWSLIFNPKAEFKKVKKCITRSNEPGFCMYVQQCDIPNVVTSLEQLLQDACVIDDIFIGICCPEFPVQTVQVHWEHMPSDTDKRTDDFGHKSEDCGIRSDAASKAQSWPWKAKLVSMLKGRIFCDAVLIRDNYVLTAAHCTRKIPKNQILVRLGQHDESSGEDYAVVEIKRHAQYNRRSMLNDIALLKLGRRIGHDEHTNTICLPDDDDDDKDDHKDNDKDDHKDDDKDDHKHEHKDDDKHEHKDDDKHEHKDDDKDDHAGKKAILLGSRGSFSIKSKKDELLRVLTNKECEKILGIKVPATILCTEARNVKERTCNADSGAPLIIQDDNKYEVIGILSWNRNDCDERFPSIFSRVSKYARWIKKHTV